MKPCLACWYPDLPHYRLLPKSQPQSLRVRQLCSVCRAGCTTDNNAACRTLSHTHSCGPVVVVVVVVTAVVVVGGLNLWSSAGFVYSTSPPPPSLPPFFTKRSTYTQHGFSHTTNRTRRPSLRVGSEIYVKKDLLVNGTTERM